MNKDLLFGSIGTLMTSIGISSANEWLELVSLILTILGAVMTLIVIPIINWYRNAKKDGKITAEEIKEGIDIAKDGVDKLKKGE